MSPNSIHHLQFFNKIRLANVEKKSEAGVVLGNFFEKTKSLIFLQNFFEKSLFFKRRFLQVPSTTCNSSTNFCKNVEKNGQAGMEKVQLIFKQLWKHFQKSGRIFLQVVNFRFLTSYDTLSKNMGLINFTDSGGLPA